MGESERYVSVEREGGVATVIMNRPPVNAIAPALLHQLAAVFDELGGDPAVRVVVLTSAIERYFMAGADIKMMSSGDLGGDGAEEASLTSRLTVVERTPKPVIAAINGHALGGGCELALCCDYRFMIDDGRSTIGLTETSLGLIPGGGGTQRLPRLIGRGRAVQMIFEGTRLRAPQALGVGLVDVAAPPAEFRQAVDAKAQELVRMATRALGIAKLAILDGLDTTVGAGIDLETRGFLDAIGSADAAEGMTAFIEKRSATFTGR
jgi:enoyl-CoA hydratase